MSETSPRLRFAPSPTGYLHIGGVRTALFNWLWARKTGGTFILRIEDTDRERSTPENEAIILREMKWLGLTWDEGPDVGGPNGPYRQMERLPLYQEFVDKLIAAKAAYRCYCTKEELDAQRAALKEKDPKAQFRYPGTCRNRSDRPDKPFVIRMAAPSSGAVTYNDMVFGEVTTPNSAQQDAVLVRNDGVALYNLGAVVDDITMGITIVARGRDHMINTPIQILLYEALGAKLPRFAHLPMMLNTKGEKLSKRDGAVSVADYREKEGIPPEALLNYLVRFGWSFGDEEVFSLADLVQKFDWERCGKGDGKFDKAKLAAITFEHLKSPALTSDDAYVAALAPYLAARGLSPAESDVRAALPLYRERGQNLAQTADLMDYLFRDPPTPDDKAVKKFLVPERAPLLRKLADAFRSVSTFDAPSLDAAMKALLEAEKIELKEIAQAARVALTGRSASPGLFEVAVLLGRDRSMERLVSAADAAERAR